MKVESSLVLISLSPKETEELQSILETYRSNNHPESKAYKIASKFLNDLKGFDD